MSKKIRSTPVTLLAGIAGSILANGVIATLGVWLVHVAATAVG